MGTTYSFLTGSAVRSKHDPGRVGTVTGKTRSRNSIIYYQIRFPDGTSYQASHSLESIEDSNEDIFDLMKEGRFGNLSDLRRNISQIQLSGRLANIVYSMETTHTEFYAYQYKPVLSFLESPCSGILLADEVGLGKTIEAGLIWTELRARFDCRRLLVVCPSMLREKWRDELSSRFGIHGHILNSRELLRELKRPRHEVSEGEALICSMQGIRPPRGWEEDEESVLKPSKELSHFLQDQSTEAPLVDLTIVDEAHYMRNPDSQTFRLGSLLRSVSQFMILLSATPINLKQDDLFYLLNIIDPETFDNTNFFPKVLAANEPLIEAQHLLALDKQWNEIKQCLERAQTYSPLASNRRLAHLISQPFNSERLSRSDRVEISDRIERINLLNNIVTRTKKSEVHENRVRRRVQASFAPLSIVERSFYEEVTHNVHEYALTTDCSAGFLLASPQRQISSCMYAAARSWKKSYSGVLDIESDDLYGYAPQGTGEEQRPLIHQLSTQVLPQFDLDILKNSDSKYENFIEVIEGFLSAEEKEKIIVFSFFRGTLDYLQERLRSDGVESTVLVGGMKQSKQEVIDTFEESNSAKVLLTSEVASEGVDLQFCRLLINYDLPWNPMRVEQRIGRLDRIGQRSDVITIVNLGYEDTIDQKIYDRLYKRLKIFERSLGGLEPILGEKIAELSKELLSKKLTDEEATAKIEQTAIAVEQNKKDQERLEEEASSLMAHGGYILNSVQAARDFGRRITSYDIFLYVKEYLERYWPGHILEKIPEIKLGFWIRLPAPLAVRLDDFIRKQKSSGFTRLSTGDRLKCQFLNKVAKKSTYPEVISQFHPLVRFVNNELQKEEGAFFPVAGVKIKASEAEIFTPGIYLYAIDHWEFSGLRPEEELKVSALDVSRQSVLTGDVGWNLVNIAKTRGEDWFSIRNEIDIDSTINSIEALIFSNIESFEDLKNLKDAENKDRIDFQIESAQKHLERQLASRQRILDNYKMQGKTRLIPAIEGQIKKANERFDHHLAELKSKDTLTASRIEICVGAIKIFK